MKNPSEMTEGELRWALAKSDADASRICDAMISAGRGHELRSETMTKSDPLALEAQAAWAVSGSLVAEKRRRMEWHGSLKRIIAK